MKKTIIKWENCTKLSYSQSNLCILMKTENGTKFLQSYEKYDNENEKEKSIWKRQI